MYAQKIEGDSWLGEKLDKSKIDKMSGIELIRTMEKIVLIQLNIDQQLGQLYELMQAIQRKSHDEDDRDP